jgi:2-amino-4-hydroxy-6-hydroxymethyldihydropteridine diphosphokinase
MKQHKVYLGLGSNIRPEHFLPIGLDELAGLYGAMDVSCAYESAAIGFEGPMFHNMVVGLVTSSPLIELAPCLRALEFRHGRDPQGDKFSSRTLDIDILTFDDYAELTAGIVLPREEITRNAFVLRPFAEIAPDLVIPGQTQSLATLWRQYDAPTQPLTPVTLKWHAKTLPTFQL